MPKSVKSVLKKGSKNRHWFLSVLGPLWAPKVIPNRPKSVAKTDVRFSMLLCPLSGSFFGVFRSVRHRSSVAQPIDAAFSRLSSRTGFRTVFGSVLMPFWLHFGDKTRQRPPQDPPSPPQELPKPLKDLLRPPKGLPRTSQNLPKPLQKPSWSPMSKNVQKCSKNQTFQIFSNMFFEFFLDFFWKISKIYFFKIENHNLQNHFSSWQNNIFWSGFFFTSGYGLPESF